MLDKIHWLGHDSYRIDGPPVIYIDPWQLAQHTPKADIILVTHDHYDHCSPPDVQALSGPNTVVIAPSAAAAKLGRATRVIAPGQRIDTAALITLNPKHGMRMIPQGHK